MSKPCSFAPLCPRSVPDHSINHACALCRARIRYWTEKKRPAERLARVTQIELWGARMGEVDTKSNVVSIRKGRRRRA